MLDRKPGHYLVYDHRDKEWTIMHWSGDNWTFLGNDQEYTDSDLKTSYPNPPEMDLTNIIFIEEPINAI